VTYTPCASGIHICGLTANEDEFLTVANFPGVTRDAFEAARNACALSDHDDFDLVVDWMVGGDIVEDFGMRRQQLDDLRRIVARRD
jgi:hypothetical protein